MRAGPVVFGMLFLLSACAAADPGEQGLSAITQRALAYVEAQRARDQQDCERTYAADSGSFAVCLAEKSEARKAQLRAILDELQQRRLGRGRADCTDPIDGDAAVCFEI